MREVLLTVWTRISNPVLRGPTPLPRFTKEINVKKLYIRHNFMYGLTDDMKITFERVGLDNIFNIYNSRNDIVTDPKFRELIKTLDIYEDQF